MKNIYHMGFAKSVVNKMICFAIYADMDFALTVGKVKFKTLC